MSEPRFHPWRRGGPGRRPKNREAVARAILWKIRTGLGWRQIPRIFAVKWNTAYRYHKRHPQYDPEVDVIGVDRRVDHD